MILGEHRLAIDRLGWLALPEQIRSELKGDLIVTRGFDRNLILYPDLGWRALAGKLMAKPISNLDVRTFRRRLFGSAMQLAPDKNGRIQLPSSLREFAGINGELILTGMYDHVELWSVEEWSQILNSVQADSAGEHWDSLGI
jgi:MraZ protein